MGAKGGFRGRAGKNCIMKSVKSLVKQIKKARYVFVCGNGGSAATAEHFTNDLFSRGIKAICLNSNNSIITMIGNDFGYKYIYKRQLDLFAEPGDLLIVFSVSGTSPNIVEALKCPIDKIKFFGRKLDFGGEEDWHLKLTHQIKALL
jgi:D-sedoheptulose 7-phosphate isomerase